MKFVDVDHPFYRPLWRRIAIVVVVAAWCAVEALMARELTWVIISGAMLVYAVMLFLVRWPHKNETDEPVAGDGEPKA